MRVVRNEKGQRDGTLGLGIEGRERLIVDRNKTPKLCTLVRSSVNALEYKPRHTNRRRQVSAKVN